MDQKETKITTDDASRRRDVGRAQDAAASRDTTPSRSEELLGQGEVLFRDGLYQRAVHLWTRVLFLDRGNARARRGIARAKAALAERQRELDAEVADARRLLASGSAEEARLSARRVLAADPRHAEAHQLAGEIAALDRRAESCTPKTGSTSGEHGTVHGASRPAPAKRRARAAARGISRTRGPSTHASPVKMAGFAVATVLVFASGALYLHLNWETIVSDGAFGASSSLDGAALLEREAPPVPDAVEMRYYNAERLAAKGRYRDALDELSRIDRDAAIGDKARSLTLRIEKRLLRGGSDEDASVGAMGAR